MIALERKASKSACRRKAISPLHVTDCTSFLHILQPRKPYVITRARERWTDDEHAMFVEALRLYGRTWRKIEEHIGTKTAVQIRSHAQKFFDKVGKGHNTKEAAPEAEGELPLCPGP